MRRPHVLARNCGGEYPRDVIVVDTETDAEPLPDGSMGHRLAFGWACFRRRQQGDRWSTPLWHRFTTRAEFWRWVLRRARTGARLLIYCHNAEFDAQVVDAFGELERRRWRLRSACLQGPPTIIRWRRGRRSVVWLDSLNYWPMSLEKLGERVGLAKLAMPASWVDAREADVYCRRDVEIVWASLLSWWDFLKRHDLGTCAPTLASQSFNAFRHRFLSHEIFVDCNDSALELARASYMGGRVECWRMGKITEPGVVLDVNSMYPAVMRNLDAPTRLLTVRGRVSLSEVEHYLDRYALIADCEIETDAPVYPVHREGRLIFPVGAFRTALATPELVHALERGRVTRVHRLAIYDRARVFTAFCDWVWDTRSRARERGDEIEAWQLKLIGNSLYGKFGQRGRIWRVIDRADTSRVAAFDSYDLDSSRWRHFRQIGRVVQKLDDDAESANSHPAIASHVTAAARVALWGLMERAGMEDIWYVDTDSLIGADRIVDRLGAAHSEHDLGGLKVERRFSSAHIRGLKDYACDDASKVKGVSRKALWIGQDAAVMERWTGWAGALRRGALDMPVTTPVLKVMRRDYRKGIVTPTGRVVPLSLTLGAA